MEKHKPGRPLVPLESKLIQEVNRTQLAYERALMDLREYRLSKDEYVKRESVYLKRGAIVMGENNNGGDVQPPRRGGRPLPGR